MSSPLLLLILKLKILDLIIFKFLPSVSVSNKNMKTPLNVGFLYGCSTYCVHGDPRSGSREFPVFHWGTKKRGKNVDFEARD